MTEAQNRILNLLQFHIVNSFKEYKSAFASYIHEADETDDTAYISDEEVAAVALANGYKVYYTSNGYYCGDDYLITNPKYDLADGIAKAYTNNLRHEKYKIDDFKPVTLEQLFR